MSWFPMDKGLRRQQQQLAANLIPHSPILYQQDRLVRLEIVAADRCEGIKADPFSAWNDR
jgi:hypothetical protein